MREPFERLKKGPSVMRDTADAEERRAFFCVSETLKNGNTGLLLGGLYVLQFRPEVTRYPRLGAPARLDHALCVFLLLRGEESSIKQGALSRDPLH